MKITVLSGGVGGARFVQGCKMAASRHGNDLDITVIANTADDITLHGLRICPDLDTMMYTLGGGIDQERGWGRSNDTMTIAEELAHYEVDGTWFTLGDKDFATHIVRTRMLNLGYSLSDVMTALCARWNPGVNLLPMTNDPVETHVVTEVKGQQQAIHFQSWWVEHQAELPVTSFAMVGLEQSTPAPGVCDAIADADAVIIAPSNPVVSVGPILGVPGIRSALAATTAPVLGISPIINGTAVRGMASQCLQAIGVDCDAVSVGELYHDIIDSWFIHHGDSSTASSLPVVERDIMMTTDDQAADLAWAVVQKSREYDSQ